jgi:hypothetical protein
MSRPQPPITAEQLAALPPEFRALLQAVIDHYEARIAVLETRIVELEGQLHPKTPQNSSLPPCTQHPQAQAPKAAIETQSWRSAWARQARASFVADRKV